MDQNNGGIIGKINTPTTTVASGVWSLDSQFEAQSGSTWPLAFPQTTIANACRFNDGSSDYLAFTPSGETQRKIATFSAWVKKGLIDGGTPTIFEIYESSSNQVEIFFDSSERLNVSNRISNTAHNLVTNAVFRDPSAWYHIVYALDTTQGTASDRQKLYVNGTQVTSFHEAGYMNQDTNSVFGTANVNHIGRSQYSFDYFDGYITELIVIDGTALDPTSFGAFNPVTNIWEPIAYTGTYGTNGYRLDFADSSALGNDVSGNNNDFTVNNLTSVDQSTDTCSNNFATLNPLVRNKSYNDGSLAEGNLKFAPGGRAIACSTIGVTKGKWYAEFKATDAGALYIGCGQLKGIDALSLTNPIWYDNNPGYAVGYGAGGSLEDGTPSTSYGSGYSDNDIVGVALDMDNYEMYISVNGTFQNSGDPTSGSSKTGGVTGAISYNPFDDGDPIFFFVSDFSAAGVGECLLNFGNAPFSISSGNADANGHGNFEYAVPSGYFALCTKNLAEYG